MSYPRIFHQSAPLWPLYVGLVLVLFGLCPPLAAQDTTVLVNDNQPWNAPELDKAQIEAALEATNKELETLPSSAAPSSVEGKKRALLQKHADLLTELIHILDSRARIAADLADLPKREAELSRAMEASGMGAPAPPADPTPEGLEKLQKKLDALRDTADTLQKKDKKAQQRIIDIPNLLVRTRERAKKADDLLEKLGKTKGDKGLIPLQRAKAGLDRRVARESLGLLQQERDYLQKAAPVLSSERELARSNRDAWAQSVEAYEQALKTYQTKQLETTKGELKLRQEAAAQALTPAERFLTGWQTDIARVQNNIADLSRFNTTVLDQLSNQKDELGQEQQILRELTAMVDSRGTSGEVAKRLKDTFSTLDQWRHALATSIPDAIPRRLEGLAKRQTEIKTTLDGLRQRWETEVRAVTRDMTARQGKRFRAHAKKVRDELRAALLRENQAILEVRSNIQQLQTYPQRRADLLDDLESFVLSKVLWLQDTRPLDLKVFEVAAEELAGPERQDSLLNWWRGLNFDRIDDDVVNLLTPVSGGLLVVLLVLLPIGLGRIYVRLRRTFKRRIDAVRKGNPAGSIVLPGALGTMLFPAYFLGLAWLVGKNPYLFYYDTALKYGLLFVAGYLQLFLLGHLFFAPKGLARDRFGMRAETATALYRSVRLVLWALVLFLLPWLLLSRTTLQYAALPRIAYLLFEATLFFALYRLIRIQSPLMQDIFSSRADLALGVTPMQDRSFLARHWQGISRLLSAVLLGILLLDIMGYHFTATQLARNSLLSLLTIGALVAIYRLGLRGLERTLWQRPTGSADESEVDSRKQTGTQARRGLRAAVTLIGIAAVASYWELGRSAIEVLQQVTLYTVTAADGSRQFVTLANTAALVIAIVVAVWLLRNLKSIYEFLVFPHLNLDRGMCYAVLTMSKYAIFIVALLVVLSVMRVDLGNLGWLVAAMGVGLGFGLQEIFANFVSGIILLVERPVRVGDLVSIGTVRGEVTHISIRATTVKTFDLQEVLVPNRDLITKEVTNWTLGDPVSRVVVPIGVAYGSDIDLVTRVLEDIVREEPGIVDDPPPSVRFVAHGESSLDFQLRGFLLITDTGSRMRLRDQLNRKINKAFAEHGIEIPFPQRDLHLRSGPWPAAAASDGG